MSSASAVRAPSAPQRTRAPLRPVAYAPDERRAPRSATRTSDTPRVARRGRPLAIAVGIIVACLLASVGGSMLLASGQLELEQLQAKVVAADSSYATLSWTVAKDESPSSVASGARRQGDVLPEVLQIPTVSLQTPLSTPTFSSAPCCSVTPGR